MKHDTSPQSPSLSEHDQDHFYKNMLEWPAGVCPLEELIRTYLASNHTSCFCCPQLTWALAWKTGSVWGTQEECRSAPVDQAADPDDTYCCWTRRYGAEEKETEEITGMHHLVLVSFSVACFEASALLSLIPADSMRLDRQKMLSFTPCVTSQANSIKFPSKEERWNCVMVVGALNLVMILSRGKWSRSLNIMINSLQSTRHLNLPPPLLAYKILLP